MVTSDFRGVEAVGVLLYFILVYCMLVVTVADRVLLFVCNSCVVIRSIVVVFITAEAEVGGFGVVALVVVP